MSWKVFTVFCFLDLPEASLGANWVQLASSCPNGTLQPSSTVSLPSCHQPKKLPKLQHKPRLFLAISFYGIPTVSHHHTFIIVHCDIVHYVCSGGPKIVPVVPHKAVAEVSKIGNHRKPIGEERLVVVNHGWQSEATDLSIDLSIDLSFFLSFLSIWPIYLSIYRSIGLPVYLSIYLSIYLSHLSI